MYVSIYRAGYEQEAKYPLRNYGYDYENEYGYDDEGLLSGVKALFKGADHKILNNVTSYSKSINVNTLEDIVNARKFKDLDTFTAGVVAKFAEDNGITNNLAFKLIKENYFRQMSHSSRDDARAIAAARDKLMPLVGKLTIVEERNPNILYRGFHRLRNKFTGSNTAMPVIRKTRKVSINRKALEANPYINSIINRYGFSSIRDIESVILLGKAGEVGLDAKTVNAVVDIYEAAFKELQKKGLAKEASAEMAEGLSKAAKKASDEIAEVVADALGMANKGNVSGAKQGIKNAANKAKQEGDDATGWYILGAVLGTTILVGGAAYAISD